MHPKQVYDMCCRNMGKRAYIMEKNGRKHVGRITKVDRNMVWIMPDRRMGGYGIGFWGFGGLGIGIAIGAIVGFALARPYWW
ncbi:hypothetical protein D1B33_13170 [Lysinibacillus yapensis]|uniref:Uncharacterized protein n=1 Tax=Ureibacillus yapensis TaxID=2304605 RepID=A0A396S5E2_9BACL|nr:hypothetical protein [Lysinibacillus yapensis]RHW34989.1 hypothetical protein D1B33_13170 [Lysinibacillus yapensis]